MPAHEDMMIGSNITRRPLRLLAAGFGVILCLAACSGANNPLPGANTNLAPSNGQEVFATPDAAVDALVAATRNDQKAELLKILGPNAHKIIHSGDPVADKTGREKFLAAYDRDHDLQSETDNREVLVVGDEEWPMPIPLVRTTGGWQFDTEAGQQEILNRRIGRNELNVIQISRIYVEAQREFAARHTLPHNRKEYAQYFLSSPGKHNGLYWPATDAEQESPLGPLIASARAEGYLNKSEMHKRTPYHGYFYKILKRQGPHAPSGAKNYIKDGHMTGGFALIAFPARYGDSGVMTFIINQNGILFEKNLGPQTAKRATAITQYDPDSSWQIVQ